MDRGVFGYKLRAKGSKIRVCCSGRVVFGPMPYVFTMIGFYLLAKIVILVFWWPSPGSLWTGAGHVLALAPLLLCIYLWLLTSLRDPGVVVRPEEDHAPETEALDLSEHKDGRVGQEDEELSEG